MKIIFLMFILTIISPIYSEYTTLTSGYELNIGNLYSGQTYYFRLDAESGQVVEISFRTSSAVAGKNYLTFYAYIEGQTSYYKEQTFELSVNGTTLYEKLNLDYLDGDKLIKYLTFTFTPTNTMLNTYVLATVSGTSLKDAITIVGATLIIIILLPIICCITCIVIIICCCCKSSSPTYIVQNPNPQPLYPVQPNQQTYVPPYP